MHTGLLVYTLGESKDNNISWNKLIIFTSIYAIGYEVIIQI